MNKKGIHRYIILGLLVAAIIAFESLLLKARQVPLPEQEQIAAVGLAEDQQFYYTFNTNGVLQESGDLDESSSPFWWLNSGGQMLLSDGVGKTITGENSNEKWRKAYKEANPVDTDDGLHPQNIFRLLTKRKWDKLTQEIHFKIDSIVLSDSTNRNDSNGVLLMHRYQDRNNLYYAGVRVDGNAVVKKKRDGKYYTLAITPLFYSEALYNRNTNPNLIPGIKWIGLRSAITTDTLGKVHITVWTDKQNLGQWQKIIEIVDDGRIGGPAITAPGLAGIRTDFLETEFDNYRIVKI
jgi:hypothetical protein